MSSIAATLLFALLLASLLFHDAAAEWVQTAKLTDSDGEEGDYFGWDLAIDNGFLVVGAPDDDIGGASDAGSVTTFELSDDGAWVAPQKLTARDAEAYDYFGSAVAISNGVVAVGAPFEDDGGSDAGGVYIYGKGADGLWTESQKLIRSDAAKDDQFGFSLAMHGNTLIAGAPGDDSFTGSVYVYTLFAGTFWAQAAKLTASDGNADDWFGWSVAIDGDTILVGAAFDDDLGKWSGSAYVFQREGQGGSWTQVAKLTPSDGQADDWFGYSVAIEGGTIFVGSDNNVDGYRVGAVYQFGEEMATWTQQNKLVARDFATNGHFGFGLAFRNGTLVVGANGQNHNAGAAYVFRQESDAWTQRAKLVSSDEASNGRFGYAVGIEDGMIIAGAYGDNSWQGSVYAFEWRASETDARPSVVPMPNSATIPVSKWASFS